MAYFWFGLILVAVIGVQLGWLPFAGWIFPYRHHWIQFPYIGSIWPTPILPALTLVVPSMGGWALGMRNMMSTVLAEDYVIVARAKGVKSLRLPGCTRPVTPILPNSPVLRCRWVCRLRRHRRRGRVLVPGHRLCALPRGDLQRLPLDARDIPGDRPHRAGSQPASRLCLRMLDPTDCVVVRDVTVPPDAAATVSPPGADGHEVVAPPQGRYRPRDHRIFVLLAIFGPLLVPTTPRSSAAAVMPPRRPFAGHDRVRPDVLSQLLTGRGARLSPPCWRP